MKLMYLAKRNKSYTSSEAFRPHWRQHGALAMSLPSWGRKGRYVHADVQPPSPLGAAHEFDGVGIVWREALPVGDDKPQDATQTGKILLEDELKAFDGPVLPRAFIVEEDVLVADDSATFASYLFFEDTDAAHRAATTFVEISEHQGPVRVVLNRVATRGPVPDPMYTYQGIVEVAAANRRDLDTCLLAGSDAGVRPDLEIVTHECLLWDDGPVEEAHTSA